MRPEIRQATAKDAEAAAWCHLLCWREAYAGLVEADVLAERTSDLERRTERWAHATAEGWIRWLAVNPDPEAAVQDRVIGFSSAGPARDDDAPTPLELFAIYARQAWWSTGLGARLLEVAVGKDPASLWVFEDNRRARTFYRRNGFVEDGVRKHDPYFGLMEIRMVRH
ncbi:GNAT family N-acetyltransferase [Kribbella sp. NPDC049174]|uniref:GNAT family N-acetyltransferase n=1 Tax=Kribbella sp. NPDC049174 TaxID=3364112 RepID=UPI003723B698